MRESKHHQKCSYQSNQNKETFLFSYIILKSLLWRSRLQAQFPPTGAASREWPRRKPAPSRTPALPCVRPPSSSDGAWSPLVDRRPRGTGRDANHFPSASPGRSWLGEGRQCQRNLQIKNGRTNVKMYKAY